MTFRALAATYRFLVPCETGGIEAYARELIAPSVAGSALQLTAFLSKEAAQDAGTPWAELPSVLVCEARRVISSSS